MFFTKRNRSPQPNSAETAQLIQSGVVRKHLIFHGRVQGVGFRYQASAIAHELGLTGWVRNAYDGTVEMEVQGKPEQIQELITQLHHARYIQIRHIESSDLTVISERSFRTTY